MTNKGEEKPTKFMALKKQLENNETIDFKRLYTTSLVPIVKSVENPQEVSAIWKSYVDLTYELTPLFMATLFHFKDYEQLHDLGKAIDLRGSRREYDLFNAKMIRYFYYSCKHKQSVNIEEFYQLLAHNREFGNKNSVLVLTNCILDFNLEHKIYRPFLGENGNVFGSLEHCDLVEELALYNFLMGYVNLVLGRYAKSLSFLDEAEILNSHYSMELSIKKFTILCKLLMGHLRIEMAYERELVPYFSLISAVRRGEAKTIAKILEESKEEFMGEMGVYFVVKRLLGIALQEGIRRIGLCYTRIRISDISQIIGLEAEYLVHKSIKEGKINCRVENGILIRENGVSSSRGNLFDQIQKTISVREQIKSQMEHPSIPVLNYERLVKEQKDLIDQFEI